MSAGGADRATPPSVEHCRQALEALVARGGVPDAADVQQLAALAPPEQETLLAALGAVHGAAALPVLEALVAGPGGSAVRRAARRALYRLAQRGVRPGAPAPRRPIVERGRERAIRAWTSGIDGSGSRALWILFEGAYGALRLCSLIVSDLHGVLEVAGGEVTKKRLDRELSALRASQKLPWVEIEGGRAVGLVAEALALHRAQGTTPPATFERWRPLFAGAPPASAPALEADLALLEGAGALLDRPELSGWFFEPERVQADAVDLLQARESRLVVSDQLKAEREDAILTRVVERELTPQARALWARRLGEMALIFAATGRKDDAALARAAGSVLADESREVRHHPFARALAARALAVAGEVALGRLTAAEASRRPSRGHDH
jgi:hypothetical protein